MMRREVKEIEFNTNYWELYPRKVHVELHSIKKLSEGVGVELEFISSAKNFSHFLYKIDNKPWRKCYDGRVIVRFQGGGTKPQCANVLIRVVMEEGIVSKTYRLTICYYPSKLYSIYGHTSPSWIILKMSDIPFFKSKVEDWIVQTPSSSDIEFAKKKWGHIVESAETDYEVAKSIINDLEPHRGVPSDIMKSLSPFEQYKRAISGVDRVWCANIAVIFSHACISLGIPCRRIAMCHSLEDNLEDYKVLVAEGHSTVKIFSDVYNQWIWIDPIMYVLGAYLGDIGPLNLVELYLYLNNPNRIKYLYVVEYDPRSRLERKVLLTESKAKNSLLNYFKRDQRFRYFKQFTINEVNA